EHFHVIELYARRAVHHGATPRGSRISEGGAAARRKGRGAARGLSERLPPIMRPTNLEKQEKSTAIRRYSYCRRALPSPTLPPRTCLPSAASSATRPVQRHARAQRTPESPRG